MEKIKEEIQRLIKKQFLFFDNFKENKIINNR